MISRASASLIAGLFAGAFTKWHRMGGGTGYEYSDSAKVYDFLYEHDYPAWFCNAARKACTTTSTRGIKDSTFSPAIEETAKYIRSLELDGYTFKGDKLLAPESDVLDAKEEAGVLESLYTDLKLGNSRTALHHLKLSEEHYLEKRWDDSISNSRKFLECVLQEIASAHSQRVHNSPLPESIFPRPVRVRDYLEREGLLETKEKEAIASIYGLLSYTGGHPYMAQNEQARLLRHLALTLSQFSMLRFKGQVKGQVSGHP